MLNVLRSLNQLVWGVPTLLLIVGVGISLSIHTGFAQLRLFPAALKRFLGQFMRKNKDDEGRDSYRALCTALAATVGTGNIAGVAGAIAIGGPGSIFWMWICALFGMVTKFAEATLAVRYRVQSKTGEYVGGPMHMIERGMPQKWKWLASVYCFFGVVAAFGVGNATQVNSVIGSVNGVVSYLGGFTCEYFNLIIGLLLGILTLIMLLGGAKRIGAIAEQLVPWAAVGYMLLCMAVLLLRFRALPGAFSAIVCGAFSPKALTGGVIGSAFVALRVGASRGVFTNEAGMGTAAIAHGASDADHPVKQGLMGIVEVFLDTILICTLTALVILCSGTAIQYGVDTGISLTMEAFRCVLGSWTCVPIAVAMCCFAVATILGWGLYGMRCAQYLFGDHVWKAFVYLQGAVVLVSALLKTGTVWLLAETVNGLMAAPNLIALAYLTPEVQRLTNDYRQQTLTNKPVKW